MLGIYVAGCAGGHLNPAITLTNCLFRGFPWKKWPAYACAQVAGCFCGAVSQTNRSSQKSARWLIPLGCDLWKLQIRHQRIRRWRRYQNSAGVLGYCDRWGLLYVSSTISHDDWHVLLGVHSECDVGLGYLCLEG